MAIAPMRRFDLLAHASTKEAVLATLQSLGMTHVEDALPLLETDGEAEALQVQPSPDFSAVEQTLHTVHLCLAFVDRHARSRSLLEQLKEPRLRVTQKDVDRTVKNFALDTFADQVRDLESRMATTRAQIAKCEILRVDLCQWAVADNTAPVD